MSDNIFLRIPPKTAMEQLGKRANSSCSTGSSNSGRENFNWHQINVAVLEAMFSSSKIADEYRAAAKQVIRDGSLDVSGFYELKHYIEQLRDVIESFPSDPGQDATTIAKSGTGSVAGYGSKQPGGVTTSGKTRWEYYSVIVADTAVITSKESPRIESELKSRAAEGWELVAVVPCRQNQQSAGLFTEFYRLFFKRLILS